MGPTVQLAQFARTRWAYEHKVSAHAADAGAAELIVRRTAAGLEAATNDGRGRGGRRGLRRYATTARRRDALVKHKVATLEESAALATTWELLDVAMNAAAELRDVGDAAEDGTGGGYGGWIDGRGIEGRGRYVLKPSLSI